MNRVRWGCYCVHRSLIVKSEQNRIELVTRPAILQMHLLEAGVLWHLLVFLFEYDYTLEESGVVTEEDHSKQAVSNRLAKASLLACSRLVGSVNQTPPESSDSDGRASALTPKNPVIEDCLKSMLTPYVVYRMQKDVNGSPGLHTNSILLCQLGSGSL